MESYPVLFSIIAYGFITSLFAMAISWFIFSRVSITRIDADMAADGLPRACPIDIFGLRVIIIAAAISLPVGNFLNHEHDPMIDVKSVRPYGTKFDKWVGLILNLSAYLMIILGVTASFFPD
ncbi:MAG: hypothetical protein ACPGGD_03885 [Thalassolituus sp.]|jgi:hypothetical protein|nr:MAG: hypothetical protein COA68_03045 [Oceanobacter sp.]|tara:strand:- start:90 stop:455 length:366 start_codon:yes stop_codon:yes gene_type:complete